MEIKAAQFPGGFVPDAGVISAWITQYTTLASKLKDVTTYDTYAEVRFDPGISDTERGVLYASLAYASDSTPVPRTKDNKVIQRASAYSLGTRLYIAGVADNRTEGRGKGSRFELAHDTIGVSTWLTWQFNDWIEMGGGGLTFHNGKLGDWLCMYLYAPASQPLAVTPGAGDCIVSGGVIVPYPGGTHTLDLTTPDVCVPLLTTGALPSGFWQWSYPNTGCGTFEPRPYADGNCHLLAIEKNVHTYVADVGLLGDHGTLNFTFPGIDPTRIPPQWRMAARLNNIDGTHTVSVTWEIECGRMDGEVAQP